MKFWTIIHRSCGWIAALGLATLGLPCSAQGETAPSAAAMVAANAPQLVAVGASKPGTMQKNTLIYDFGRRNFLEESDPVKDTDLHHPPMFDMEEEGGIRHIYELSNPTEKPIVIEDYSTDCECVMVSIADKRRLIIFPYTVKPKEKVRVAVMLLPNTVAPGRIEANIGLVDKTRKHTLAKLTIKGYIQGPFRFSASRLDFGTKAPPATATQTLQLTIDRRIQRRLATPELSIVSSNPKILVKDVAIEGKTSKVKVKGDTLIFPSPMDNNDLPQDLRVSFKVVATPGLPLGKISGRVQLEIPGMPYFMLVQEQEVWLEGEVVGLMKLLGPNAMPMPKATTEHASVAQRAISCAAPLQGQQLQVQSSNPAFAARLIPVEELAATDPLKLPETSAVLEVQFTKSDAPGYHDAVITLTNTINAEKIRIHAFINVAQKLEG